MYFSTMEELKLLILDLLSLRSIFHLNPDKILKISILDLPSICPLKDLSTISMAPKPIYGPLVSLSMNFYMVKHLMPIVEPNPN